MTKILTTLMASLALGGLVAGCGGDDGNKADEGRDQAAGGAATAPSETSPSADEGGAAAPGEGEQVVIRMKGIQFQPKSATVNVGQEVSWPNDDPVPHNVVAQEGAEFKSPDYGKGKDYKFTPTEAGTIKYECTLHPGMVGELKVVQ